MLEILKNGFKKKEKNAKQIEVTYIVGDNSLKILLDSPITVAELFEKNIKNLDEVMAVRVNNNVRSLTSKITEDSVIELIDVYKEDGRNIYIRTLMYILSKAVYELYQNSTLKVEYQLGNSMYVTIDGVELTKEVIEEIEEKMRQIVGKNLPLTRKTMKKEEATKFYANSKLKNGLMQLVTEGKESVTLYFCEDYFNYFYGVMPATTGSINKFELRKYEDGMVVMYPDRYDFSKVAKFESNKKLKKTLEEYNDIYELLEVPTVCDLNKKIRKDPRDLILLSEALHEKKIFDLSKQILKREGIKLILIAGPSSSGKTTFAGKLSKALRIRGIKPVMISVDNYFVNREDTPKDEDGNYNFESIYAIDLELFNKHLDLLIQGKEIEMPYFNFKTGKREYRGDKIKLKADEILVIEGIHCLNDKLTEKISKDKKFKIYISALTVLNIDNFNRISTTDTRLIRRIVRDHNTRGYDASTTIGMWESVRKGERENIFPFQEEADFMFNSSVIYELPALKRQVTSFLEKIDESQRQYSEARRLLGLLQYIEEIDEQLVPNNALIREFLGDSIFE